MESEDMNKPEEMSSELDALRGIRISLMQLLKLTTRSEQKFVLRVAKEMCIRKRDFQRASILRDMEGREEIDPQCGAWGYRNHLWNKRGRCKRCNQSKTDIAR